ncbi:uncharacterized protein LOC116246434 [Nymphaea colorata]|nr:uncharacterized protein LOC116246434 [Nymphaea colorata]
MKIQPVEDSGDQKLIKANDLLAMPAAKSRLKRMLERQFPSILRTSSSKRAEEPHGVTEIEPSSVCLAKMVQNFLEETDKQVKCGRSRCNCFNSSDSSDDDHDSGESRLFSGDATEILKSLVSCASVPERNLLADTARLVEVRSKSCRQNVSLKASVAEGLLALGYDASICKSKWDQTPSHPAGEHEYIDVIVATAGEAPERLIVDVDFKSEFEIARSTSHYRAVLHSLPSTFVGKLDRLQQIVTIVSEAARQSLKRKGLHFPPWRSPEYVRAKWLSPYERTKPAVEEKKAAGPNPTPHLSFIAVKPSGFPTAAFSGDFQLRPVGNRCEHKDPNARGCGQIRVVVTEWTPPPLESKGTQKEGKIVAGLASVLREKPQ